jgi:hypothetical protein
MKPSLLSALFSALLLLAACGTADQPVQATETETGSGPAIPNADLWLTISDSIGIELGDSNLVLGMPAVAAWMPDNRLAVMDMQKYRISVFTPEGDFVTSLGRQGSGPGEFLLPSWLSVTPSGGLAVCDAMAGELDFFNPSLEYTGSLSGFFPSPPVITVFLEDTVFVGMKPEFEQNDDGMFMGYTVALWNTTSPEPVITYHRELAPFDPSDMSGITGNMVVFAASPEGLVYTSKFSTEEYSVNGWNPDGTPLFTINEPFTRVEKTQEDIDTERQYVRDRMRQGGAPDFMVETYEPEPFRYAISSLGVAPDGNLWVGMGTYNHPVFRVYDSLTGDYLFTAALEITDETRDLTVQMNQWGFTAIDQISADWPRVYVLEELN